MHCKYSTWHWLNVNSGEIKPFNCGSWACHQHQGAVAYSWACKVAQSAPQRMVTLTNIPTDKTRAYLGFKQLVRDIRQEGLAFEYGRFLEIGQKTGMLHFHLAQRGDFIPKHWLSARAEANGLGKITFIEQCYGAGPSFYLGKYVTKEAPLPGWRKVSSSQGFFRAKEVPADLRHDWVLIKGKIGL